MAITFRYKTVKRPDGTQVKTPSIPILLMGKERFETVALLDSGADISVIPLSLAELLGLEINSKKVIAYGIGGQVDSVDTSVNILIEKGHEKYNFKMPVKVILEKYDFPILLGRVGFFDKFIISFDQQNEKITLKKSK